MFLLQRVPKLSHVLYREVKTLSSEGYVKESLKPVITIPVKVQNKALKRQGKLRQKELTLNYYSGNRKIPVIQCRRSELDHFMQQTYPKFKKLPLASEHWQSYRTNGDFFTLRGFLGPGHRSDETPKRFADIPESNLDEQLVNNLLLSNFVKPTLIQSKSIPELLKGQNCIIASETGNGKTLAFLVPAIQQVLNVKKFSERSEEKKLNAPKVLIVTPGRELAQQIYNIASTITSNLPVDVRLEAGYKTRGRKEVDILVGSFGAMNQKFESNRFSKDQVRHVIFDEADSLLDDTFNADTIPFLIRLSRGMPEVFQVTFVGATYPTSLPTILGSFGSVDEFCRIGTNRLHSVLPHITQKFIRVQAKGKENLLLDILADEMGKKKQISPTLIFSNKSSTASFVHLFLKENNIESSCFHSGVTPSFRGELLDRFLRGKVNILSCTDLASRGIDTSNVRHVINYDFPLNMSDYIHRVGRVGRVGCQAGSGKVTNFVRGGIQTHLVQQIEESVRTQSEIPNVNNNIIRIIKNRAAIKHKETLREQEAEQQREDGDF